MLYVLKGSDPDFDRGFGHLTRIGALAQLVVAVREAGGPQGDAPTPRRLQRARQRLAAGV
jgi:hypothetical protein